MMELEFKEIQPLFISIMDNKNFFPDATYFVAKKNGFPLFYYGIINRGKKIGEAFLIFRLFQGKVLTKQVFNDLFKHLFSLGYEKLYTYTTTSKWVKLFKHFKKIGINEVSAPEWDRDSNKTWFLKRL